MASPMVEGRLDPHRKAHFTLHISDRIADGEVGSYTSVKYNHKPVQSTASRIATLTSSSANNHKLTLEDRKAGNDKDIFVFTGQKTAPKKSYILLLDPASQHATLEPLASNYTFNISSKNGADISSEYPPIYPRRQKEEALHAQADHLSDEPAVDGTEGEPDPDNPYDFRHFLDKEKARRGDESEYNIASSPDYRTGTGSALNTPKFPARKPASTGPSKPRKTEQAVSKLKRTSPGPERRTKAPAVRLERRATAQTKAPSTKPASKAAQAAASKIKSAEIVHSSDESDADADGELEPASSSPPRARRSPPPVRRQPPEPVSDEDVDMEDVATRPSGLEIEDPDAGHSKPRHNALASIGYGQNPLGYLKSPSNGPISLASAANSVEGSPNAHAFSRKRADEDEGVIDFGNLGADSEDDDEAEREAEDGDVEPMDLGPPAQAQAKRMSLGGEAAVHHEDDGEGEEEDPLYKEMMEGLAGGESSEESEEE